MSCDRDQVLVDFYIYLIREAMSLNDDARLEEILEDAVIELDKIDHVEKGVIEDLRNFLEDSRSPQARRNVNLLYEVVDMLESKENARISGVTASS
ncbi:MAG: hypothetical protein K8F91_08360 [Candidatus Obscuribacterales bacterium]|nr:hypothetical protein [Candidatus Obscuribacterales bacterium]